METMKAVVTVDENKVELQDLPKPVPGPNEILIKVYACMLCTWEQWVFSRRMPFPLPFIGGHEFSGVIEAIGSEVDPEKHPIGAKVAGTQIPSCGECDSCRSGHDEKCVYAGTVPHKALAEYIVLNARYVFMASDDIPFDRLMFAEPLGCVITAIDKLQINLGDDLVVQGGGLMGLLNALVAKNLGACVILSEPDAKRREKALELGIDYAINPIETDLTEFIKNRTKGIGCKNVINTVSVKGAISQGMSLLSKNGTFLMFGKMFPNEPIEVSINQLHDNEWRMIGTMSASINAWHRAVNMLSKGVIRPEEIGLLSDMYDKEEAMMAYKQAIRNDTYRIGIKFNDLK